MLSKIVLVLLVLGSSAHCEELDPILLVKQFFLSSPTASAPSTSGSSGSSSGAPAAATTAAPPAGSSTTFTPDPTCLNHPTRPTPALCCLLATDPACPAVPPANPDPLCPTACVNTVTCLAATDAKCVAPAAPAPGGSTASTPGTISIRPLLSASGPASG